MLVAAAVCPCPPLLVPEVAGGAASELDAARAACYDAIAVVAAACPDRLVVVGPAEQAGRGPHPQGAAGSFRGFGVDLVVRLGAGEQETAGIERSGATGGEDRRPALPASLAVAAWLLQRTEWNAAPVEGLGVDERLAAERCLAVGREIAESAERAALLVMGDGTACRSRNAPGYFDERAAGFDDAVARALGTADTAGLTALEVEPAHELKAAGRSSWQVLAGAAEGAGLAGALLFHEAPYGVGYFVAAWS